MDIHIIVRPKTSASVNHVQRAGTLQFNKWIGNELRALGTATLWWKRYFLHARADEHHSIITLEILPNEISRILHFGFSIEILRQNRPIYLGEWRDNTAFSSGLTIKINLESIQLRGPDREDVPTVTVFPKQRGIHPFKEQITYHG